MALDFGAHPDVVFKDAPLSMVLCQVKFSPVLSLRSLEGVAGFQEGLRRSYPKFLVQASSEAEQPPANAGPAPVWLLADESEEWIVAISQDYVALQTRRYSDTDGFVERLRNVLWVLDTTISPSDSRRIGFRKVNEISVPQPSDPSSLVGVIRRELLGGIGATPALPGLRDLHSVMEFIDDEHRLVVQYGLARTAARAPTFVLDCDYFTERPFGVEDGAIVDLIRGYSKGITSFFHWAIEDDYKPQLGPEPRDAS